jgi:hypothetical protein
MVLCRESARPAIAVKFDNQHAVGISHHLDGAIGTEVVSLMGLHSTLPGLLGFARKVRMRCRSHGAGESPK